jgi:hypothetical protein
MRRRGVQVCCASDGRFGVSASLPRAAIDHVDLPLTDLDKVPVRVPDKGADFIAAVDGISHE